MRMTTSEAKGWLPAVLTSPLPEPREEVVQQSREAVNPNVRGSDQKLDKYPKYRQSRVLNVFDNLVHVVVGAVVDASVYVIVHFADLDVLFKANLFHLNEQMTPIRSRDNPHQSLRLILFCPGDRHFDVESSLILQKKKR